MSKKTKNTLIIIISLTLGGIAGLFLQSIKIAMVISIASMALGFVEFYKTNDIPFRGHF